MAYLFLEEDHVYKTTFYNCGPPNVTFRTDSITDTNREIIENQNKRPYPRLVDLEMGSVGLRDQHALQVALVTVVQV